MSLMLQNYRCQIHKERPKTGDEFMVALVDSLPFPDDGTPVLDKCKKNLGVIAANDDLDGHEEKMWAYVPLNPDEKLCIGRMLENTDAEVNQWYWCLLFSD